MNSSDEIRSHGGDAPADLVAELVSALPSWQLAVLRLNDRIASSLGIAPSDLQCLFVLDRGGPASPGELARRVDLTTGATSRMVERLLRAGMVTRTHDTVDRRRVNVAITPAAHRALHDLYDPLDEQLGRLLADLGARTLRGLRGFVADAEQITVEHTEQVTDRARPAR